uniref:E3 ubiquitin-protein ligase RNF166 n=1 Tax=Calidris pygmaea TaxID=425635 RepID=A0A8C3KEW0_9CHAR
MFRSLLVAAAQRPQAPGGPPRASPPAGPAAEALEAQFSCPICLEVFHRAVGIAGCGHTFCGECLQPCLQVPSPLCPLCRMPFDPKKVEKASSVEKQLSSYKAPCRGCSKKVTLAKMRSHVSSCAKVQEQMANCPKFVPVVPTSQPIPSNIPNRSTFVCPYCGARNLDQQELVKHCMENHRNDPNKVVCPVCSAMPWGDPSYKSANFLQHLLHRHKFSYDTFVVSTALSRNRVIVPVSCAERLGDETSPSLPVPGSACPAVQPLGRGRGWISFRLCGRHMETPTGEGLGSQPAVRDARAGPCQHSRKMSLKEGREMLLLSVKTACFLRVLH